MMECVAGELSCPVCLELYTQPVILPCSHILCRTPCAERLFVQDYVRCPVCRDNCFISGGLNSLPRVLSLDRIIEQYNNPPAPPVEQRIIPESDLCRENDIPCQLCQSEPMLKAVHSCLNCNASYCTACLAVSHPDREPFSQHQLVRPRRYARPKAATCPRHEGRVTIWCQTCQVLGCLFCADDPKTHQGHSVLSIDQAAAMYKDILESNLKKLSVEQNLVQMAIGRCEQRLETFQGGVEERRSYINDQCDQLVAEVEKRRQFFLADLQYEARNKNDTWTHVISGYSSQVEHIHSVMHYTQEALKEKEKRAFIQFAKLANDKATKRPLTQGDSPSDGDTSLSLYHKVIDMRKELSILRAINYLRAPDRPVVEISRCSRASHNVIIAVSCDLLYSVQDGFRLFYSRNKSQLLQNMAEFIMPHEERKYSVAPSTGSVCLILDGLTSAATYWLSVKAYNTAGESDLSEPVSLTTLAEPTLEESQSPTLFGSDFTQQLSLTLFHTECPVSECSEQASIPVPEIRERMCHTYSYAIQIHSPSPQELATDDQICHYLLYREASLNRVWKTISLFGRVDHRVFGLESNTAYEFVITARNEQGQCCLSNRVILKTEQASY